MTARPFLYAQKTTQGGTQINPDHPCTSLICSRFINVKVALWVIEANDQRETMNPTNNITIYRLYFCLQLHFVKLND
jgi:hypothetical protein